MSYRGDEKMRKIGWYTAKIKSKLKNSEEPVNDFYRRNEVKIGNRCLICSYILTTSHKSLQKSDRYIIEK